MVEDKGKQINIWTKIGEIDRRLIWWILTIILAIVLINPIGLPLQVTATTTEFNSVLNSLPKGSVVLMEISTTAYAWDEIGSGAYAIAKFLRANGHKLILVGVQTPDATVLSQLILEKSGWLENSIEGKDYVNLGYVSGGEITVFNMATNFQFIEKDVNGVPLSEYDLTRDINGANEIDIIIDIHSAAGVDVWYMRHWTIPFSTKFIELVTSASIHGIVPYYESGDCLAYLGGVRGAAEFEYVSGYLGDAIKSLDAQSVIHFYFLGLVVLGNLAVLAERRKH